MKQHTGYIRLAACLIIILSTFPAMLHAQAEHVPANHPVYDYLNRMQIMGNIPGYSRAVLPLERKEVNAYLAAVETLKEQLSETDRALFDFYSDEFLAEERGKQSNVQLFGDDIPFSQRLSDAVSDKEKFLYAWANENRSTTFFMEFLGSAEYRTLFRNGSANNVTLGQVGGRFRGTVGGMLGYGLQATNGTTIGSKDLALTDRVLRQNANYSDWHNAFFDVTEAYISASWGWGSLSLGKEQRQYGNGYSGRVLVSANSPLFDAVRFDMHAGAVRFSFLHGFLLAQRELVETNRPFYENKYIVIHRLEADLFSTVRFGVSEAVIYSQRQIDFGYLNPFNFYKSAEHAGGDRDNPMLGFDVKTLSLKGTELYGSWMIDDIDISKFGSGWWGNKFIWQAGMQNHSLIPSTEITFEYTRVEPYVWTHVLRNNEYTNKGDVISLEIPPNSDELFFRLRRWVGSRILLSATYQHRRHGTNEYTADGALLQNHGGSANEKFVYGRDNETSLFLDGPRETQQLMTCSIRYEPIRNIILDGSYRYRNIASPEGVSTSDHFLALLFQIEY